MYCHEELDEEEEEKKDDAVPWRPTMHKQHATEGSFQKLLDKQHPCLDRLYMNDHDPFVTADERTAALGCMLRRYCLEKEMSDETFMTAVWIFDRYIERATVQNLKCHEIDSTQRKETQIDELALYCLSLSSKWTDACPITWYVNVRMDRDMDILGVLGWKVRYTTPETLVPYIILWLESAAVADGDFVLQRDLVAIYHRACLYVMFSTLIHGVMLLKPSLVAAACVAAGSAYIDPPTQHARLNQICNVLPDSCDNRDTVKSLRDTFINDIIFT